MGERVMKRFSLIAAAATLAAGAAYADGHASGDPAAGEETFSQCGTCHVVADGDNLIAGRGKTGPNLYGIVGRQAGTYEGFRYGKDLVAAGEAGLVWDEASFVEYAVDPRGFLQTFLDDKSARSRMAFKLRDGADDIWAYLVSVSPEPATN